MMVFSRSKQYSHKLSEVVSSLVCDARPGVHVDLDLVPSQPAHQNHLVCHCVFMVVAMILIKHTGYLFIIQFDGSQHFLVILRTNTGRIFVGIIVILIALCTTKKNHWSLSV